MVSAGVHHAVARTESVAGDRHGEGGHISVDHWTSQPTLLQLKQWSCPSCAYEPGRLLDESQQYQRSKAQADYISRIVRLVLGNRGK